MKKLLDYGNVDISRVKWSGFAEVVCTHVENGRVNIKKNS